MSEKDAFLAAWEKEVPTTLKVLRAFPSAKADLKPAEKARTAKELAWTFVFEGVAGAQGVDGELKFPPKNMPPMPATWDGIVAECEKGFRGLAERVRKVSDAHLNTTIKFLTAPKQMGDVRRLDFLWFLLSDMIHHRGQMSVYLRMAGGKVPSIYGPSADEPWN
jgi:hypothetical protein